METKRNNKLLQKILLTVLVVIMLINLIMPTLVIAGEEDDDVNDGGALSKPIKSLCIWLSDSVIGLIQDIFVGNDQITRTQLTNDLKTFFGIYPIEYVEISIPNYRISPESIFANKIPAFDINFFKPGKDVINTFENEDYEILKYWVEQVGIRDENGEIYNVDNIKADQLLSDLLDTLNKLKGHNSELNGMVRRANRSARGSYLYGIGMVRFNLAVTRVEAIIEYLDQHPEILGTPSATKESTAKILQPTVAYWYNLLRNIAIIGLLSVLVYVGIRIVLSSTAADKSKYKEMLKDWVVAICLLFFMHYFMNFIVTITQEVPGLLIGQGEEHIQKDTGIEYKGDKLIGDIRLRTQFGSIGQQMTYTVIYMVIVIYTVVFSFKYLKRVIYMAFFTIMAPFVALTYPLDKMRDGKSQAFDMWLKEYTINAIIPTFHLILYYVLVDSAIDLAIDNPIYALVAIGFLIPADKLLRKFFGLDKAESSGVLKGALGGALVMQGINAVRRGASALGRGGKHQGKGGEGKEKDDKPIRTADKDVDDLIDGIGSGRRISDALADNQNQGQITTGARNRLNGSGQDGEGTNTQEGGNTPNKKEKTHGISTATTMGIKWALKGGLGVTKLAARATAAGALGTIGIAAGLASDDYSNVFKYGLAGLGAGNALAGAGINTVKKLPSAAYRVRKTASNIRDEYERGAYGPAERKRRQNERADNQFLNDKEIQRLYKDKFGKDKYEQAMRAALKYREYGVTDNNAIIKAMKLSGLGNSDDSRRILIANSASQIGRKDIDAYRDRLLSRGLDRSKVDSIIDGIRKFNNIE